MLKNKYPEKGHVPIGLYGSAPSPGSEMRHRCNILKERSIDHEQYSLKVKRPVLEDKGKYIALS